MWDHIINAIDICYNTEIPYHIDNGVDGQDELIRLQMAQPNQLKTSFDKPVTFHALNLLSANNKFNSKHLNPYHSKPCPQHNNVQMVHLIH